MTIRIRQLQSCLTATRLPAVYILHILISKNEKDIFQDLIYNKDLLYDRGPIFAATSTIHPCEVLFEVLFLLHQVLFHSRFYCDLHPELRDDCYFVTLDTKMDESLQMPET